MSALTICLPEAESTDVTNTTEATHDISNDEFLQAIFKDLPDDVGPVVTSFIGNPQSAVPSVWAGRRWVDGRTDFPASANNYFSLSAFKADENGKYRRRKKQFYACCCLMLDDIGTKAAANGLTLEPSWMIETSSGNYQAGYIFAEPIVDLELADQIMNAVIAAKLCDPGANGPSARLARLPLAVNGKSDPAFRCKLKIWSPRRRYTVAELVTGLQLNLSSSKKSAVGVKPQPKVSSVSGGNDIWRPRPKSNPALQALKTHGLYKAPISDTKHDITCPWVKEHTDAVDSGTAYYEPDAEYPSGGFSCLHGHCVHRTIGDLLELYDIDLNSARMKAVLYVKDGEIDRVVTMAERTLADNGGYYQHAGNIVKVVVDPLSNMSAMCQLSMDSLTMDLAGISTWLRFDARKDDWVCKDPIEKHVKALLNKNQYSHLPVLRGISQQPYFRDDRTVVQSPGYDADTLMYGAFEPCDFPIPESPTQEEAQSALKLLKSVLDEFEFVTEADAAAALCAILTAAIRATLSRAPMMLIGANEPGTGKTYLTTIISIFATSQPGHPITFPERDEEFTKLLLAELRSSPPVIEFDNLTSDLLPHKSLCSALTSEVFAGRLLGSSVTQQVSTRSLFVASGNNVQPVNDMLRRCLTISLTCSSESPAQRKFKNPDLLQDIRRNRGNYISAALTIIRAWVVAGEPVQPLLHLAGFEQWSLMTRHPLVWLGEPDPATPIFKNMAHDPEREMLARLYRLWSDSFGSHPMRVREVITYLSQPGNSGHALSELLEDTVGDHRGGINPRSLGKWLAKMKGRVVDGQQLVRVKSSSNGDSWAVQ